MPMPLSDPDKERAYQREWQRGYRARNPEKVREAQRRWRDANREHKREYALRYRAANLEKELERHRRYRATEAGKARERAKGDEWKKRNPVRWAEIHRRADIARRARQADAFVESVDPVALLIRDSGICGICLGPLEADFHIDHIVPLARDGEHSYANCQVAHPACNIRKGPNVG